MFIGFGEWLPDQNPLRTPGLVDVENAIPTVTSWVAMQDAERAPGLSALAGTVQGAFRGRTQSGIIFITAGTASKLYILQGVDFVDESGAAYTLSSAQSWSFALHGNTLVAVAPGIAPQRFLFGVDPNYINLSADASRASRVMVFNEFVVLGNIVGQGVNAAAIGTAEAGLHWSAIGNPNSWPQVGTQAALDVQSDFNLLPGSGGAITDMVAAEEWAIVLRERQVWRMDYVGAPKFFDFRCLDAHRGCNEPGGAIAIGGAVYFPSEDGFLMCDGATVVPIGEEKVDRFWKRAKGTGLISVAHDPNFSLVVWKVPGTDLLIGYQKELQRWTKVRKQVEWLITTVGGLTSSSLDVAPLATIDMDAAAPVGLGDVDLDALFVDTSEILGAFLLDHALYSFSSVDHLTGVFETGDYSDDAEMRRNLVRNVRPLLTGPDVGFVVALSGRNKPNDTPSFTTLTSNSRGVCKARVSGRFLRGRLSASGDFSVTGLDANVVPLGAR